MGMESESSSRREFLKRAGLSVGATLWAAPAIQLVGMKPAIAQVNTSVVATTSPPTTKGQNSLTFTPVEWTVEHEEGFEEGVYTVFMIADVSPLTGEDVEDLGGSLIWDGTRIDLCKNPAFPNDDPGNSISIREVGDGFVRIGDGFQTNSQSFKNCDVGYEIQAAFDHLGLPSAACLSVKVNGIVSEFCAPLAMLIE